MKAPFYFDQSNVLTISVGHSQGTLRAVFRVLGALGNNNFIDGKVQVKTNLCTYVRSERVIFWEEISK